jgi:hypothetical protein
MEYPSPWCLRLVRPPGLGSVTLRAATRPRGSRFFFHRFSTRCRPNSSASRSIASREIPRWPFMNRESAALSIRVLAAISFCDKSLFLIAALTWSEIFRRSAAFMFLGNNRLNVDSQSTGCTLDSGR